MLVHLSVRDIVLIDRLDLDLSGGLTALTGETGAGKSIILDALGLVLGDRADRGFVRTGASQGSVTATFRLSLDHPVHGLLDEQGIALDDELCLRRVIGADGRSRGFVNDQAVGLQLMREVGARIVEIHGQNAQIVLTDPGIQRDLLDAFGGLDGDLERLALAHEVWAQAAAAHRAIEQHLAAARTDEAYLRHLLAELETLAPEPGEEERLADKRQRLVSGVKIADGLSEAQEAVSGAGGVLDRLAASDRRLERIAHLAPDLIVPVREVLARALIETDELDAALTSASSALDIEADALQTIEDRLHALRDAARKYRRPSDELAAMAEETRSAIEAIDGGTDRLDAAAAHARDARQRFEEAIAVLSRGREAAAASLARALEAELPPLKLGQARFRVALEPLEPGQWTATGAERVRFEVMTNPGQPFAPLARIASGGELSRFMLALKVVLARQGDASVLLFDEVDAGIGGATADAVGERLARLAHHQQVIVVTHAAQVAARASNQLHVEKRVTGDATRIVVEPLDSDRRTLEIARMISGAELTEAARGAAASLLRSAGAGAGDVDASASAAPRREGGGPARERPRAAAKAAHPVPSGDVLPDGQR